jgi:hypothetical protein
MRNSERPGTWVTKKSEDIGNSYDVVVVSISILDAHVPLKETTEFERAEEDVPDAVVDFFEADILASTDDGDIDPTVVPTDAAVSANVSDFKAVGIFERRQWVGHLPG